MTMSSRVAVGVLRHLEMGNGGLFPLAIFRSMSSLTVPKGEMKEEEKVSTKVEEKAVVASYWGVKPPKIAKEDGTVWPWKSFRPWEAYEADLSIDLKKHHAPASIGDKMAFWTVKALRFPTDVFFQNDTLGCKKDGLLIGSC